MEIWSRFEEVDIWSFRVGGDFLLLGGKVLKLLLAGETSDLPK